MFCSRTVTFALLGLRVVAVVAVVVFVVALFVYRSVMVMGWGSSPGKHMGDARALPTTLRGRPVRDEVVVIGAMRVLVPGYASPSSPVPVVRAICVMVGFCDFGVAWGFGG